MRDPSINAEVATAIEEARVYLFLPLCLGRLGKGPADPDGTLRAEAWAHIQLLPDSVLPEHLREHVCQLLSERPAGRLTYGDGRDLFIVSAIERARSRGFHPTRSNTSRDKGSAESACSIVQKALARLGVNMSERMVEDIWSQSPGKSAE